MISHAFTLVRHGQSTANADGIHQGRGAFPLSDLGHQQVELLAAHWKQQEQEFDGLLSSPLLRTRQTAEILSKALGYSIEYDELLEERDVGQMSGLHFEESHARFPLPEVTTPYYRFGVDGESEWRLHMRAGRALENLMQCPPGHYLVVSHGGLMNRLLMAVLGAAPQASFQGAVFAHTNTAHSKISFDSARQRWQLEYSNDTSHMNEAENQDAAYQFLLIRHAESEANAQGIIQGSQDYALSAKGEKQAKLVAERLAKSGLSINGLISSPQSRAQQTAKAIAHQLKMEMELDERLVELHMGNIEGKTMQQVQETYPQWPHTGETLYQPIAKNGESMWAFFLRTGEFLSDLFEQPPGRYIVVSHGGTLNSLINAIVGSHPQPDWRAVRLSFENTSLSRISYSPAHHKWRIHYLNNTQHLNGLA